MAKKVYPDRDNPEHFGEKYAAEFCAQKSKSILSLIATYEDRNAADLLCRLREAFWGGDWQPKKRKQTAV